MSGGGAIDKKDMGELRNEIHASAFKNVDEVDVTFSPIAVPRYFDGCIGVVRMLRSAGWMMEAMKSGWYEGSAGVKMITVEFLADDTVVADSVSSSMSLHDRFRHYNLRSK